MLGIRLVARTLLGFLAAFVLVAFPLTARSADSQTSLNAITYVVTTQREAFSVPASVFATYIGSCLNGDAQTPMINDRKHTAVYVCNVPAKTVAEMQDLKFIPNTVGFRE